MTVNILNRFGNIIARMTSNSAFELYEFLDEDRMRQSLEIHGKAIGYSVDGYPYQLVASN